MRIALARRLSLEALLAWGFGSLIIGSVVTAALAVAVWRIADAAFDEYERQDAPIAAHAADGLDAWVMARHQDELFILAAGHGMAPADAKARLLPQWSRSLGEVRDYLAAVRHLGDASDRSVLALLPAVHASLRRYSESFTSLVDETQRLGNSDSGLEGDLRARAAALEALVARSRAPALHEGLLRLRRIHMEFALTGKEQYVREFQGELGRLEHAGAPGIQGASWLAGLSEYGALFKEYAATVQAAALDRQQYLQAAAELDASLEQLEREGVENAHSLLRELERRVSAAARSAAAIALLAVALGATMAFFAGARIRLAARRIIGFARRVAAGRLETRLDRVDSGEFGALEAALNTMADRLQESDEVLSRQARALEDSHRRIALLSEMTALLQGAASLDEARVIIAAHLQRMDLAGGGALYLHSESGERLEALARWGRAKTAERFPPEDCWAVRRGQPYGSSEPGWALTCAHASEPAGEAPYLCLPLVTHGGMLGLLHLVFDGPDAAARDEQSRFARRLAEQLGLALANLRLRQKLREHSLRDPLTGLYNRRFLEESLPRELARAARDGSSLAVLMIDADHFKRLNDAHGHEAGDAVLRQLGTTLRESCRASDLACRFGGEEFTVVLPNTGAEGCRLWAARLLEAVRRMRVESRGAPLPPVTVSVGAAFYPEHGADADTVRQAADRALYEAKAGGRDRLVVRAA